MVQVCEKKRQVEELKKDGRKEITGQPRTRLNDEVKVIEVWKEEDATSSRQRRWNSG